MLARIHYVDWFIGRAEDSSWLTMSRREEGWAPKQNKSTDLSEGTPLPQLFSNFSFLWDRSHCSSDWPPIHYVAEDIFKDVWSFCLYLASAGWQIGICQQARFRQCWGWNAGFCACYMSSLPTEPHPQAKSPDRKSRSWLVGHWCTKLKKADYHYYCLNPQSPSSGIFHRKRIIKSGFRSFTLVCIAMKINEICCVVQLMNVLRNKSHYCVA